MGHFTEVLIDCVCECGVQKSQQIIFTQHPLPVHLESQKPYAYGSMSPETGDVRWYIPEKDTHAEGPIFVNFENIVREVPYEERLALFKKIWERNQKHTDDAMVFLLSP